MFCWMSLIGSGCSEEKEGIDTNVLGFKGLYCAITITLMDRFIYITMKNSVDVTDEVLLSVYRWS